VSKEAYLPSISPSSAAEVAEVGVWLLLEVGVSHRGPLL
jgi:hypothetical protein